MSSAPSVLDLGHDARWLAQALDPATGIARLVEITPEAYRAASFLDDRMFQQPVNAQAVALSAIEAALPADARHDARWIFHIGHVGSTLVARLLGELEGVLAIREPQFLRDCMAFPPARRTGMMPTVQALFSRSFAADQAALVKTTSFVSELAAELVPAGERALFLFVEPRTYVATILAGQNSLKELAARASGRAQRLAPRVRRLAGNATSHAHLAAAAWACEMTTLEACAAAMTDRQILWADFDRQLDDMEAALAELAQFFGFEAPAERVREIVHGPLMSHYSKALEFDYSPALRRQLIDQQLAMHGPAIDDALAMLERSAQESPLLARALARNGAER